MPMSALPAIAGLLAMTVGEVELAGPPADAPARVAASKPCSAPEYRQFDFWLGRWDVREPDGKAAGANRITRILGGCAVREEWAGVGGTNGTSLNMYDASSHRWRQTWVDDKGNVLLLKGQLRGGKMVLEGESPSSGGANLQNRISWTPLSGGRVRQLWESSKDGGKTWTVAFDGTYSPKKG